MKIYKTYNEYLKDRYPNDVKFDPLKLSGGEYGKWIAESSFKQIFEATINNLKLQSEA